MIRFKKINTQVLWNVSFKVVKVPKITKEEAMDMCIEMWIDYIKGKYPSDIPIIHVKR